MKQYDNLPPVSIGDELGVIIIGKGETGDAIGKVGNKNKGYTIIIKNTALEIGDKVRVKIYQTGTTFAMANVVSSIETD